jgi:antitoxin component YwqK of YwqJK toxin-antitoxin module
VKNSVILGLVVFVSTAIICCKRGDLQQVKQAGYVPYNFVDAQDSRFSKNQDTLFYDGRYFSGHVFHLYPSKDTAFDILFLNGLQEGITRKWHVNKHIAEERFFVNGKKEGIHKAWWENGKLKFIFKVSNDAYEGNLKEWYPSGQLAKNFNYVNGQEEGSQQLWWADGSFRANYVVRGGRKYGSIGVKLCLNPNDSIYKK